MPKWMSSFLSVCVAAGAFGSCLPASGCAWKDEARLQAIRRESVDAEARADAELAADLEACADDLDCRRAAVDRYSTAMAQIQATRDAQVDVLLDDSRAGR